MTVLAGTALVACGASPPAKAPSDRRPYSRPVVPSASVPWPPQRHLHPPD